MSHQPPPRRVKWQEMKRKGERQRERRRERWRESWKKPQTLHSQKNLTTNFFFKINFHKVILQNTFPKNYFSLKNGYIFNNNNNSVYLCYHFARETLGHSKRICKFSLWLAWKSICPDKVQQHILWKFNYCTFYLAKRWNLLVETVYNSVIYILLKKPLLLR